jgi:hypothetical protein
MKRRDSYAYFKSKLVIRFLSELEALRQAGGRNVYLDSVFDHSRQQKKMFCAPLSLVAI